MSSTDTPLTGQAPLPLPAPFLGASLPAVALPLGANIPTPPSLEAEQVETAIGASASSSTHTKSFGIVSAMKWAEEKSPQRVRHYIWMQADDLEESLRLAAAEVARAAVANLESIAANFGVEAALTWAQRQESVVPSWRGCVCFNTSGGEEGQEGQEGQEGAPSPSTTLEAEAEEAEEAEAEQIPLVQKSPDYNHHFWPSPRPKLFAKALGLKKKTHEESLQALADKAHITVAELLEMNPLVYEGHHIDGMYSHPLISKKVRWELYGQLPPVTRALVKP